MLIAGGSEGIMGAVQRGAGRAHNFALGIRLPSEQRLSETADDPKLVTLNYFFAGARPSIVSLLRMIFRSARNFASIILSNEKFSIA